ncbi:hypothetical protein BVC80_901g45 [Macleaya cordata]|uniref:F-box protein At3g26010-like beta-propeller domain-containing protein n=1 Tax=Macleaya cordata TaxID=56857 RepID=A0A200QEM3_MACCD|nr:hypothetical protein BVC80_901g45 [Macleaya cordata]
MMVDSSCTTSLQPRCESSIIDYGHKYLTEGVLFEFFLRLPLKSIYKFRCASKLWLSLLSNPNFIAKWMRFNSMNLSPWAIMYYLNYPVGESNAIRLISPDLHSICHHDGFSFRFLYSKICQKQDEFIHVVGSSNGLVLYLASNYHERIGYYVCNPLTKKYISLPQLPKNISRRRWLVSHGFNCEPSSSSPMTPTTYTIVRFSIFNTDPYASTTFDIDIFSSDLGEWNTYEVSFPQQVISNYPRPPNLVIHNGVSYWIEGRNRIIAYDLTDKNKNKNGGHQCRLIDLPEKKGDDNKYHEFLGESEGLISYSRCESGELSFWILDDEVLDDFSTTTGSWVWRLVHNIKTKDMLLAENCEDWFIKELASGKTVNLEPLAFNPVHQNVLILGYNYYNMFAYNIRTRLLEVLIRDHPLYPSP